MSRYTRIGLVAVTLTATGIGAYAAINMKNEATALVQAKGSIVQPITTAEQHASGKATRAGHEQSKAGLTFDVEVLNDSKVFDVKADSDKGMVTSSAEPKAMAMAEREGNEDNQDD